MGRQGAVLVKNKEKGKSFYTGDIVVYLTILLLAAGTFWMLQGKPSGGIAIITQNGTELHRIDLENVTGRMEIQIGGRYNELIVVENGRIRFEQADCPDQICVNTGWISRPGQVSVCVPAGVILKITGDSGDEETDIFLK